MNTIHTLGAGRLRVLKESRFDDDLMLGLDDAATGRRITLCKVPVGKQASLVAVVTGTGNGLPSGPDYTGCSRTGFAVGAGVLRANQPVAGLGPADRIGIERGWGRTFWRYGLLDFLDGRTVRLEAHPDGCRCGDAPLIPAQRATNGQEARR